MHFVGLIIIEIKMFLQNETLLEAQTFLPLL